MIERNPDVRLIMVFGTYHPALYAAKAELHGVYQWSTCFERIETDRSFTAIRMYVRDLCEHANASPRSGSPIIFTTSSDWAVRELCNMVLLHHLHPDERKRLGYSDTCAMDPAHVEVYDVTERGSFLSPPWPIEVDADGFRIPAVDDPIEKAGIDYQNIMFGEPEYETPDPPPPPEPSFERKDLTALICRASHVCTGAAIAIEGREGAGRELAGDLRAMREVMDLYKDEENE